MISIDDVGDLFAIHVVEKDKEAIFPFVDGLRVDDELTIKHFSCIYVHPARTMQLGNRFDIFHMQRREIKHGDLAFIWLFYSLKRRWGETLKLRWLVHWVTILLL